MNKEEKRVIEAITRKEQQEKGFGRDKEDTTTIRGYHADTT